MKAASSYRTKRRKIQQEMEILGNLLDVNLSNSLEPQFNISLIEETTTFNKSQINTFASNNLYSSKKIPSEEVRDSALCYNDLPSNAAINYIIPNEVNDSNAVLYDNKDDIKKSLGEWAVDCSVPQSTVNRLLSVLKYKAQLTYLPKDYRTLLKSTSTKVLI